MNIVGAITYKLQNDSIIQQQVFIQLFHSVYTAQTQTADA